MTALRPTIPGSLDSQVQTPKVHKSIPGVLGIENPPDLPPPLGGEAEASHGGLSEQFVPAGRPVRPDKQAVYNYNTASRTGTPHSSSFGTTSGYRCTISSTSNTSTTRSRISLTQPVGGASGLSSSAGSEGREAAASAGSASRRASGDGSPPVAWSPAGSTEVAGDPPASGVDEASSPLLCVVFTSSTSNGADSPPTNTSVELGQMSAEFGSQCSLLTGWLVHQEHQKLESLPLGSRPLETLLETLLETPLETLLETPLEKPLETPLETPLR
ncbi:hypothetical protein EYF80_015092 [Liparis tanakae]|uniref:Uncharacterized protein n=1 Tax=Liparis tanakae TaxID=230148 RepID=A0A4Z2IBQ0_9TELE|nr:hypothetical protein EYF80_015092 [Liparis tanakae]